MALSGQLGEAGMTAQELRTTATVSMEKVDGGFAITAVHLDLVAKIPAPARKRSRKAANGQGKLPGVEAAQCRHHAGRAPRVLIRRVGVTRAHAFNAARGYDSN
jgi:hypothetical protein